MDESITSVAETVITYSLGSTTYSSTASNPYRANAKKIYIDYWNCMWSPYIGLGGNKSIEQIDGLYYFQIAYYESAQTYYWGHVIPRENSSLSDVDGARCRRNSELLGHCVANQILDDFGNRVYIVSSTGLKRMTRSFFALDSLGMLDYDADGLTNIEEIDMESGLITKIEDDRYEYPTLKECLAYGNVYTEEGLERFYNDKVSNNLKEYLNKIKVLPLISDPTMKDSDGDGILDNVYDEDGNVYEWVRESEDVFNFSDEKPLRKDVIWEWPAVYTDGTPINRLQSSFGEGRGYPHNGIDITPSNDKAGKGIAVSSYAGRIKTVVWGNVSAGNYVEVETIIDGKKYIQRYLHLNVIDSSIKKDRNINKGDIIGIIGNTGDSSGEHLHYAIGKDVWNNYIDPIFLDNFLNNAPVDNDLVMHMVVPKSLIPTCSWKCEDCENYIEKISLKYNLQWKGWK